MWRKRAVVLLAAVNAGCSNEAPAGGVILMFAQDGSLTPDGLRLSFGAPGSDANADDVQQRVWRVPGEANLPATLALNATDSSSRRVNVAASLWLSDVRLDERQLTIENIPRDRYAAVAVLFGARCSASVDVCDEGQTCDPRDGSCAPSRIDASKLPAYTPGLEDTFTWAPPLADGDASVDASTPSDASMDTTTTPGVTTTSPSAPPESPGNDAGSATVTTPLPGETNDASATSGTTGDEFATSSDVVSTSPSPLSSDSTDPFTSERPNTMTGEASTSGGAPSEPSGHDTSGSPDTTTASMESSGSTSSDVGCSAGAHESAGECLPWADCPVGTYVASPGSSAADQRCEPCPANTFSNVPNAVSCSAWSRCGFREVTQPGSSTRNVVCDDDDVVLQFGSDRGDTAVGLALDAAGALVSVGSTRSTLDPEQPSAGGWDAFIQKRNPDGTLAWTRQFGTTSYDQAYGVVAHSGATTTFTVAGYTEGTLASGGGALADIFLRRYEGNGEVAWTTQYGTANLDMPYAIAATSNGELVVTGRTYGSLSGINQGESDFFVLRFDASGAYLWAQQFGTAGNEYGFAVAVDEEGNIIAGGHTAGSLFGTSAGGVDAVVLKLTPDGSVDWQRQFGTNAEDVAYAVAVDEEGNVYAAGTTDGRLGSDDPTDSDGWLRKWNARGDVQWTRQFGTDGSDAVTAMVIRDNYLYVTGPWGRTSDPSDDDVFVRRYTLDGQTPTERTLGTPRSDLAFGLAVMDERVFVCGDTTGDWQMTNLGEYDAFVAQVVMP